MNEEDAARVRAQFNDADYIARLKSRDEDVSDEFLEWLYWKLPRHIAYKFNKPSADAEDLASIAALHVWEKLDRFKEIAHEGAFEHWIYRVVYNRVLDELDRLEGATAEDRQYLKERREIYELEIRLRDFLNRVMPQHEEAVLGLIGVGGQGGVEEPSPEKKEALRRFLRLSESERSILILRDILNYEYEDIARDELVAEGKPVMEGRLKLKRDAVYKRYGRAQEKIREIQNPERDESS